jgi:hypothetical protein
MASRCSGPVPQGGRRTGAACPRGWSRAAPRLTEAGKVAAATDLENLHLPTSRIGQLLSHAESVWSDRVARPAKIGDLA